MIVKTVTELQDDGGKLLIAHRGALLGDLLLYVLGHTVRLGLVEATRGIFQIAGKTDDPAQTVLGEVESMPGRVRLGFEDPDLRDGPDKIQRGQAVDIFSRGFNDGQIVFGLAAQVDRQTRFFELPFVGLLERLEVGPEAYREGTVLSIEDHLIAVVERDQTLVVVTLHAFDVLIAKLSKFGLGGGTFGESPRKSDHGLLFAGVIVKLAVAAVQFEKRGGKASDLLEGLGGFLLLHEGFHHVGIFQTSVLSDQPSG